MRSVSRLAAVVTLALLPVSAVEAVPIVINPGAGLAANPAALAAWTRATNRWAVPLQDAGFTVNVDADLANMGSSSILGSTSSVLLQGSYNLIRNAIVADAAGEPDDGIVANVPTAAGFSAYVPAGFGLTGTMAATKANLKALGFGGLDAIFGVADGTITFNTGFSWDYDSSDGITPGSYDFETTAAHELGHLLGFVSIVDTVDFALSQQQAGGVPIFPLDLFRFRAPGPATVAAFATDPRSLEPAVAAVFSDVTSRWAFSTGAYTGDGRQASHWKDDSLTGLFLGLMDPTLASGTSEPITAADLRALDVIGWDVQPVPEPGTLLLFGTALAGAALRRRVNHA